ncbi:progranulin-like [Uloborus diversus]|uniref:progranulin-like n=1 Tax=Uloborus diversus TaxID=327109 RepID=UPI0024095B68|nr:progranulin-like [Uloborus diversus]XP_054724396.1 progranulin-like [Uloborus diversus]
MKLWTVFTVVSFALGLKKDCPGGSEQKCPDSATCCELLNGKYGCCPLENAICCDDHIHCCPSNTKCDAGLCVNGDFENVTALKYSEHKDVVCPGGFTCPEDNTCCESSLAGTYACCPLENAVCCSDYLHCCPKDTVCDLEQGKCNPKSYIPGIFRPKKKYHLSKKRDFVKMSALTKISEREGSIVCPDESSQCPNGYTCCMLPSGEWGCCPFPNAVCCPDMLHCCPESMTCDPTSSTCSQGSRNVSATLTSPAEEMKKSDIVCPDGMHCAETMTCCSLGMGHFGCCPFADAVCCEDNSHCCPQNFTCNVEQQRCDPS